VLQGLLAGYGVAVPVGAIGALIVSLTARTSLVVGSAAALGVATADGVYALLAAFGGAALAHVIQPVADLEAVPPPISAPLRWAAMVILLFIAVRSALIAVRRYRDPLVRPQRAGLSTPPRAYAGLLGLTLLNPMTIVYFGALVLGRGDRVSLTALDAGVFVLAASAASASWQLLLAGGGALVGRVLTSPRGRLVTALAASAVIVVLSIALVA
jgi:arginine exporter protein ArgO